MHVAVSDLTRSVVRKSSLADCTADELQALVHRYPYFVPARLLYLKKLQADHSPDFREELSHAELWLPDTPWLDHLLFGTGSVDRVKDEILPAVFEEPVSGEHAMGIDEPMVEEMDQDVAKEVDIAEDEVLEEPVDEEVQEETDEPVIVEDVQEEIDEPGTVEDVQEETDEPDVVEEVKEETHEPAVEKVEEPGIEQVAENPGDEEPVLVIDEPDAGQTEPTDEHIVYHNEQRHAGFEAGEEGNPVLDYYNEPRVSQPEPGHVDENVEQTGDPVAEPGTDPVVDIDETLVEEAEETEEEIGETGEESKEEPDPLPEHQPIEDELMAGDSIDEPEEPVPGPIPELRIPSFKIEPLNAADSELTFEPYHTVDYFASQGIKAREEEKPVDRFSVQLRSFTDWLKTMKKIAASESAGVNAPPAAEDKKVEQMAEHSIQGREVVTEAMAEVWEKQGNTARAIALYQKLSLLEPGKSTYFAAKIEQLKNS